MAERSPSEKDPAPIPIRPPSFQRRFIAAETDDPDLLVALASDESYFVRRQALNNPNTPQWILALLVRAGASPDLRGKGVIDPDLDPASLHRLVETGPWARQLVAEHPNTSSEVLAVLKDQPSIPLRLAIAAHPNADGATLASLCCDIEEGIRIQAGRNPNCPPEVIELLITAGSDSELVSVTHMLGGLNQEQFPLLVGLGPWGRFLAARHPGCPVNLLESIVYDPEWQVRSGLLDNPNTPAGLIERLLDAPVTEEVSTIQGLSQPQISEEDLSKLAAHPCPEVRLAVARHPAATPQILGLLATDGVREIRRLASGHPETDPAILQRLVQAGSTADLMGLSDPDAALPRDEIHALLGGGVWARQLAVRHPNTDAETLAHLLCDRDPKIREWAAVHPNLSPETKQDLLRAGSGTDFQGIMPPDPTLPGETLVRISQLGSWGEWVVANNPYAPEDLLANLADSEDWQVRRFVAGNPNAPQAVLNRLAGDPVEKVRKTAMATLASH